MKARINAGKSQAVRHNNIILLSKIVFGITNSSIHTKIIIVYYYWVTRKPSYTLNIVARIIHFVLHEF